MGKKHILMTGASGRIGSAFYEAMNERYAFTLIDLTPPAYEVKAGHTFVSVDLSRRAALDEWLDGVEVVVHLAGNPDPDAEFEQLLPSNILASTYVLESASKAGCARVIYASSAQTIEGYPVDRQITAHLPVNPANLYGVSKCYGEALCAYYSGKKNLSTLCVRIGAFEPEGSENLSTRRDLSAWLSPKDAVHLLERCIEVQGLHHAIVHGISNNRFKRLDLSDTMERLGYAPQGDAFKGIDFLVRPGPGQ